MNSKPSTPSTKTVSSTWCLNGVNVERGRSRVFWAAGNLARTQSFAWHTGPIVDALEAHHLALRSSSVPSRLCLSFILYWSSETGVVCRQTIVHSIGVSFSPSIYANNPSNFPSPILILYPLIQHLSNLRLNTGCRLQKSFPLLPSPLAQHVVRYVIGLP